MKSLVIKYQTSELVPAPFANAIEINAKVENGSLNYAFELTYLDRDDLTEDEILEEGFNINDDYKLAGSLPVIWINHLLSTLEKTKKTYPKELLHNQDFWEVIVDKDAFYPENTAVWKRNLEELQQAIFEQNKIEFPLNITVLRNDLSETILRASFENRLVEAITGEITKEIKWEKLDLILKNIFSGEYIYEKAMENKPTKNGLYVNLGDAYWFEVGKSLLIKPSKITAWIDEV